MSKRIESFSLKNYAQLSEVICQKTGNINLFIGENGTGKSTVLKTLYVAVRSAEDYHRGDDVRIMPDVLAENLRWTFQVDRLGDLVSKGAKEPLDFSVQLSKWALQYSFASTTSTKVVQVEYTDSQQTGNSVFIPAKEILSLQSTILKSREIDRTFGFDNTFYDLAKALRLPAKADIDTTLYSKLNELINGKVEFDEKTNRWFYKKGNAKYSINTTSEGIKKAAILEHLLESGFLTNQSVLFLDEPESSLHPKAISTLLDVIDVLANDYGVQTFIASHSYFVIKKLRILAMKRKNTMPCISLSTDSVGYYDLSEEMPDNSIIQESVRLYKEEIGEVLG